MGEGRAASYEAVTYEERNGVAWVTLNRPDVHNAFNGVMARELRDIWRGLRTNDDVRVAVLTAAGEKAFCTGIDRMAAMGGDDTFLEHTGSPFMFEDPGQQLGPKSNDLWKPVIAAVNGMACGGAFYMLGEVDIIIAADHATFFDPHTTYGMTTAFEAMLMLQRMPLGEIMRLSLTGNYERMSAERAHQVGLVSEVVPGAELGEAARRLAETIASQPSIALQGTVRAIWAAQELSRSQALAMGFAFVGLGNRPEALAEGQQAFASGKRAEWRLR